MGLLDEAIREHLELKRRRGADPTEIERLEREALGPVRRMAQEGPGAEVPASPMSEADYVAAPAPDHDVFEEEDVGHGDEAFHEHDFEEDTAAHDVPPSAEPAEVGEAPTDSHGHEDRVGPAYDDEDGPETAEYDVEAEHGHTEHAESGHVEGESDDMLEETPEFLQDAPEHDRLWFEQRPPRDFDFDG